MRLPSSLDQLSVDQLDKQYGEPLTEPIERLKGDKTSLPPGMPSRGISPAWLGKEAHEMAPAEARIILSDFGEAFSPSDPKQVKLGKQCCAPRAVLAPEAYLEPEKLISFPYDIWALACAIWPILGLRALFDCTLATCDDITCQQVDILGPLPPEWWKRWDARHKYLDETARPKNDRHVYIPLEQQFGCDIQGQREKDGMGAFGREETIALLAMLRSMLIFRPEERATAAMILKSDWMVTWGLPAYDMYLKA